MVEISYNALRRWDKLLLSRYPPFYETLPQTCGMCALGRCDFTKLKKGKCGITPQAQASRETLLFILQGLSAHLTTARKIVNRATEILTPDKLIDVGEEIEAPLTRIICNLAPKKLMHLDMALTYIERECLRLFSATHFGGETSSSELESMVMHAGMLDIATIEIADIAQTILYSLPKGNPHMPLISTGLKSVDLHRPAILVIGHDAQIGIEILRQSNEKIGVYGLCCMGHDIARYSNKVKIVGNLSQQIKFVRTGFADVVVVDEQCIRPDLVSEVNKTGAAFITTSYTCTCGLPDMSDENTQDIIAKITARKVQGALIPDHKKAGEVAIKVAMILHKKRKKTAVKFADDFKVRAGRGLIRDIEIKAVGPSVVQGEIPGIISFSGCPADPEQSKQLAWMAEKLAEAGYIIVSTGCSAIDLAYGDVYEKFGAEFDKGNIANLGSCVSASHGLGAGVKIANIFLHRGLEGNFVGIADFIINRVGMCIVGWGAHTPKAFAIFTGANRLGIPVISGKTGYKRQLLGKKTSSALPFGYVYDARLKERCFTGPVPRNLFFVVDSIEDALLMAIVSCMRPNDTPRGRSIKLENYIKFSESIKNVFPGDAKAFVRTKFDIPDRYKNRIKLFKKSWVPDATLLENFENFELSLSNNSL